MRIEIPLVVVAVLLAGCGESGSSGDASESPPTPEERLRAWEELPAGTSVPVTLGFAGPLPDSTIAALLTRNEVRPYTVYLVVAGMGSSLTRDRTRASLEVLGEAREQAVAQLRTALCAQPGRARAMLATGDPDVTVARQMLAHVNALQRAVPELEAGAPAIYGVEAVGGAADVRALREDPDVATWEPGWLGRIDGADTVVTPGLTAPGVGGPVTDSAVLALTAEEVRARFAELAENGLGSCESATPSDEPR